MHFKAHMLTTNRIVAHIFVIMSQKMICDYFMSHKQMALIA